MIGALDIGGTHVTAALVDAAAGRVVPGTTRRVELDPAGSRGDLVTAIVGAADAVASPSVTRWGVAAPGPFDYERGIFRIRGLGKLEALYGVDLRSELAPALGVDGADALRFLNDADAFLLGEVWAGAARGHERAIGLTLGSGLGSAFFAGGELVHDGPGVFPGGRAHVVEFRGRPVEETLSRRGLLAAYGEDGVDVKAIAERARDGDGHARETFTGFAEALGEFVEPWRAGFRPTSVVVGGAIARAWDLLGPTLEPRLTRAAHLDDAPLLGAARWVDR